MTRFVKVDLTEEECEAVHSLCDLAKGMMEELGHTLSPRQRETLILKLNSVRFKMGAASALFGGQGAIIPPTLPLDVAARRRKN